MNSSLDNIIAQVDDNFNCISIDFNDSPWSTIPAKPGWYVITTNMPIELLKTLNPPQHKAHINIPRVVESASSLYTLNIAIRQSGKEHYVVYNGEASNLKARAREHIRGHAKTYCLCLSEYEIVRQYEWRFCYATASSCCRELHITSKALRLAVEQGWRAKHGWPILCGK
jgi:hypothetical protein